MQSKAGHIAAWPLLFSLSAGCIGGVCFLAQGWPKLLIFSICLILAGQIAALHAVVRWWRGVKWALVLHTQFLLVSSGAALVIMGGLELLTGVSSISLSQAISATLVGAMELVVFIPALKELNLPRFP